MKLHHEVENDLVWKNAGYKYARKNWKIEVAEMLTDKTIFGIRTAVQRATQIKSN